VNDFQTGQPRQTPPPSNVQGRQGDAALVERCRNGEMAAFEELYKTHATRLYNVACRLLASWTHSGATRHSARGSIGCS
jgi:hypothetical protein